MIPMIIHPKDNEELKFVKDLIKKLGVKTNTHTEEEIEDMALSRLMKMVDKTKKAPRAAIMKKLRA